MTLVCGCDVSVMRIGCWLLVILWRGECCVFVNGLVVDIGTYYTAPKYTTTLHYITIT